MTDAGANNTNLFDQVHAFAIAGAADALTDAEVASFEQLLNDNAEARRIYLEYIQASVFIPRILAALETPGLLRPSSPSPLMGEGRGEGSSSVVAGLPTVPPVKSPVLGFLGGVVDYVSHSRTLMFALIGGSLGLYFAVQLGSLMLSRFWAQNAAQLADDRGAGTEKQGQLVDQPKMKNASGANLLARLTNAIDCQGDVADSGGAQRASAPAPAVRLHHLALGTKLYAGQKLNLTAGLAELTFGSGAKVILTAPLRFDVTDALGGRLERGKLTAKVPHSAAGFTIATPGGKVVDLGTEFGVNVNDDGVMDMIVYVGDVQIESSFGGTGTGAGGTDQPKVVHLHAGQAITVGADHIVKPIPPENEHFVRNLAPLGDKTKAEAAYVEFMKSLKPAVWFRMEGKPDERVLHDDAGGADAKLVWDGPGNPFVKGEIGKGVWLRGAKLKDFAIVPGYPQAEHGKLSVSAWVYADSRPALAAIASNWGGIKGQFRFGLSWGEDSDRVLSVELMEPSGRWSRHREPNAPPFALYEWQHVAFTVNGPIVRLYRQGREVAVESFAGLQYPVASKALAIGASLDDADRQPAAHYPNFWDGKLDEIAVFNDALTAEQVHQLSNFVPR